MKVCKHCNKPIIFEPYFTSATSLPNPPVWIHDGAGRACDAKDVDGYVPWPVASPNSLGREDV